MLFIISRPEVTKLSPLLTGLLFDIYTFCNNTLKVSILVKLQFITIDLRCYLSNTIVYIAVNFSKFVQFEIFLGWLHLRFAHFSLLFAVFFLIALLIQPR